MNARADKPAKRQMKVSLFLTGDGSYHMAGWRLPGSTADGGHRAREIVRFQVGRRHGRRQTDVFRHHRHGRQDRNRVHAIDARGQALGREILRAGRVAAEVALTQPTWEML